MMVKAEGVDNTDIFDNIASAQNLHALKCLIWFKSYTVQCSK